MFLQSRLVRGQTSMNLGRNLSPDQLDDDDNKIAGGSAEKTAKVLPPGTSISDFHAIEDDHKAGGSSPPIHGELPSKPDAIVTKQVSDASLKQRAVLRKWKEYVWKRLQNNHVRFYEPTTHQKAWAPRPHHVSFSGTMWVDLTIVGVLYRLDEFFVVGALHDVSGFWVPFMILLAIYDAWEYRPLLQAEFRTKGISFVQSLISLVSWLLLALMGSTIPYEPYTATAKSSVMMGNFSAYGDLSMWNVTAEATQGNSTSGEPKAFEWSVYDQTVFAYLKLIHGALRVVSYLEILLFSRSKRARIAAKPRFIMYTFGTLVLAVPPILIAYGIHINYVVICYLGSYLIQKAAWNLIFFLDIGGMRTEAQEKDNLVRVNMPFIITRFRDWTQLQLGACVLGLVTATDLSLTSTAEDVGAKYFVVVAGYFFLAFLDMYSYASEPTVYTDHALITGGWSAVFWFDSFLLLTMSLLGVAVGLRYVFQNPAQVARQDRSHLVWLLAVSSTLSLLFILLQQMNHKSRAIIDTRRRVWIVKALLSSTCLISPAVVLYAETVDQSLYWVTFNLALTALAVLVVHAVNGGFRREVAKKAQIRLRGHLLAIVIARQWLMRARQRLDSRRIDLETGRMREAFRNDEYGGNMVLSERDETDFLDDSEPFVEDAPDVFEDVDEEDDDGNDDEGNQANIYNETSQQRMQRPPSSFLQRFKSFRSSKNLRSAAQPPVMAERHLPPVQPVPETMSGDDSIRISESEDDVDQQNGFRTTTMTSSRRIAAGLAVTADIADEEERVNARTTSSQPMIGSSRGSQGGSARDRQLASSIRREANNTGLRRSSEADQGPRRGTPGSSDVETGASGAVADPNQSRRSNPNHSRRGVATPNTSRRGSLATTGSPTPNSSRRGSLRSGDPDDAEPALPPAPPVMTFGFRGGDAGLADVDIVELRDGDHANGGSATNSRRSRDPNLSKRSRLGSDMNGSKRVSDPAGSRRQRVLQLVKDVNSSVRKRVFGSRGGGELTDDDNDFAVAVKPVAIRVLRKVMNERFYDTPKLLVEQDVFAEYSLSWSDLFLDIIYIGVVYKLGDYLLIGLGLNKAVKVDYVVPSTVFLFAALFYAVFSLWWAKLGFTSKCGVSDVFHKGLDMVQGLFVVLCAVNISTPQDFMAPGAAMPFVVTACLAAFHITMWFLWTEVLFGRRKDVTTNACANRNIRREYLSLFALFLAFLGCGLKAPLELISFFWLLSWFLPLLERLVTVNLVTRPEEKAPFLLRYVLHRLGDGNLILLGEGVFQIIRSVSAAYRPEVFLVFTLSFLNMTAMRAALFEMDCFDEHAKKHVVLRSRWGYLAISFLRSLASPAVVAVGVALKSIVSLAAAEAKKDSTTGDAHATTTQHNATADNNNSSGYPSPGGDCFARDSKEVQIFQMLAIGNVLALASFVVIYHMHRTYYYKQLAWRRMIVQFLICGLFLVFPWIPCMNEIAITASCLAVWCIAVLFHALSDDLLAFHHHHHHHHHHPHNHHHHHAHGDERGDSFRHRKSPLGSDPRLDQVTRVAADHDEEERRLRRRATERAIAESRDLLRSLRPSASAPNPTLSSSHPAAARRNNADQDAKYIFRSTKNLLADFRQRASSLSSATKALVETLTPSPALSRASGPFGSKRSYNIPPVDLGANEQQAKDVAAATRTVGDQDLVSSTDQRAAEEEPATVAPNGDRLAHAEGERATTPSASTSSSSSSSSSSPSRNNSSSRNNDSRESRDESKEERRRQEDPDNPVVSDQDLDMV